ncbi:hypothetical protein AVEN_111541-1 [Araneus ventricosus]|uniref:Secreted protein n=1 Tax=Araneus ventricosus TaxID=182803 RepID=A0A4Y2M4C6_ARAVE|nr:hypothetical protein AVEN_111541-1 [Araneus ventricosus]
MWIYLLIILGFCNGALCTSALCQRKTSEACLLEEEDFEVFPGNEKELKDVCNFAKTTLQCAVDFVDKCGKSNFDLFHSNYEKVEKLMDAAADICRRESELYSRVVQLLPCTKGILRNDEELCRDRSREAIVNLERTMVNNKHAKDERDRLYKLYDCLYPVLSANCFLVQTSKKCGSQARNTALEIMGKVGLLETECLESNRDEVLQMLEIVQFLTGEEIYTKQLL